MRLIIFQPDIAQNTGAMLRLTACLGIETDIIEPLGFIWDVRRLKQTALDYFNPEKVHRYRSWQEYEKVMLSRPNRLVLLTTKGEERYDEFRYASDDLLIVGQESQGVPEQLHRQAFARVYIPMMPMMRSMNVAIAAGIVLSEALRQTKQFSK
ncbi:MAG: hypothetical protein IPP67_01790 [Rhodospirillaceae bacterium]|nr:hypothetical protein [Rhodospirillaceae bacterium]